MSQTELKKKRIRKLYGQHMRAIELRYQGNTYQKISDILTQEFGGQKLIEPRIRRWFNRGGVLDAEYLDYAKKENERRRRHIVEEMKKVTAEIPKNYSKILNRDESSLSPSKLIGRDLVLKGVLKDLCQLLGFKIEDTSDSDKLDEFWDEMEEEVKKDNA
jgi:hypothetical protein